MSNEKQKVVIYTRVATQEQAKSGYSLKAQDKILKEYARVNNFEIVEEFSDIGSGFEKNRQGFNEMLNYLEASEDCTTILVETPNRLSRNVDVFKELQKYTIIYTQLGFVPSLNSLVTMFAKHKHKKRQEQIKQLFDEISNDSKKEVQNV